MKSIGRELLTRTSEILGDVAQGGVSVESAIKNRGREGVNNLKRKLVDKLSGSGLKGISLKTKKKKTKPAAAKPKKNKSKKALSTKSQSGKRARAVKKSKAKPKQTKKKTKQKVEPFENRFDFF